MAELRTFGQRSWRVAMQGQSFSLPTMISMRLRRLGRRVSWRMGVRAASGRGRRAVCFDPVDQAGIERCVPTRFQRLLEPVRVMDAVGDGPLCTRQHRRAVALPTAPEIDLFPCCSHLSGNG